MTSLVPLNRADGDNILWENLKPCSTSYCRPVQFSFVSEAVVINHKRQMDDEIKVLLPTKCNNNMVSHLLMMTMIDAKVCSCLSEANSNASCSLCLTKGMAYGKERLDTVISKTVSTGVHEFGLSLLHAHPDSMPFTHRIPTRFQEMDCKRR